MNLIKFKYKNLMNDGVEFGFEEWVRDKNVIWKKSEMYVLEEELKEIEELYESYKSMIESGDCWDGMDEDEMEWDRR